MRSIKYLLILLILTPDSKIYSQSEIDCIGYSKFSKHAKLAEKPFFPMIYQWQKFI